jgi:hypothetical protein
VKAQRPCKNRAAGLHFIESDRRANAQFCRKCADERPALATQRFRDKLASQGKTPSEYVKERRAAQIATDPVEYRRKRAAYMRNWRAGAKVDRLQSKQLLTRSRVSEIISPVSKSNTPIDHH